MNYLKILIDLLKKKTLILLLLFISILLLTFKISSASQKQIILDPCKKKEINFLHFIALGFKENKRLIMHTCDHLSPGKQMKYIAVIDLNNKIICAYINWNDGGMSGDWSKAVIIKKTFGKKNFSISKYSSEKISIERKIVIVRTEKMEVLEYSRELYNPYDYKNHGRVVIGYNVVERLK
jgi:hypothetical protein